MRNLYDWFQALLDLIHFDLSSKSAHEGTNKDYSHEAKPSKGKIDCTRTQLVKASNLLADLLHKPFYKNIGVLQNSV